MDERERVKHLEGGGHAQYRRRNGFTAGRLPTHDGQYRANSFAADHEIFEQLHDAGHTGIAGGSSALQKIHQNTVDGSLG
ncbi:hypothetical protein [Streptomyces adustus]|uniref:hypothetical protein n=1 Tax=Streptomyces adustus TaxID=1609272 RepID=UPI001EE48731|nr:hypothetical protein [Streptomyces adustus]